MGGALSVPDIKIEEKNIRTSSVSAYFKGIQGYRLSNEDAHIMKDRIHDSLPEGWGFFAIFDGHAGKECSEIASNQLLSVLLEETELLKSINQPKSEIPEDHQIKNCIIDAFLKFDDKYRKVDSGALKSGSTATCLMTSPSKLYLINLGDSRTIVIAKDQVIFETLDHKPDSQIEKMRIIDAGGNVENNRIDSTLAVSRAFGDFEYKSNTDLGPECQMVSPVPDITIIDKTSDIDYVILACDGVWDVIQSQQMAKFVDEHLKLTKDPEVTVKHSIFAALSLGSYDNISMMLVDLNSSNMQTRYSNGISNDLLRILDTLKSRTLQIIDEKYQNNSTDIKQQRLVHNLVRDAIADLSQSNPENSFLLHSLYLDAYEYAMHQWNSKNHQTSTNTPPNSDQVNDNPAAPAA